MSITEITRDHAQSTDSEGDGPESDFERYDVTDHSYIKVHPTTAVGGTAVALRRFPGDPNDDDDDGFVGLVVEDPFLKTDEDSFEGSTVFQSRSDPADLKVVNTDDKQTDTEDVPGVIFDTAMFKAVNCETFEGTDDFGSSDRYIIKLTGNAGRSAARCLDVSGLQNGDVVRDDSGVPELNENGYPFYNGGLVEKHPENDDNNYTPPRYVRDPQLRPDMQGEDVIYVLEYTSDVIDDYEGNSYWSTVLVDTDDGRPDVVEPTTEFEPDEDLVMATRWLEWTYPSDERIDEIRQMRDFDDTEA